MFVILWARFLKLFCQEIHGSFRKLGVPCFGILIIRILQFRVLLNSHICTGMKCCRARLSAAATALSVATACRVSWTNLAEAVFNVLFGVGFHGSSALYMPKVNIVVSKLINAPKH